MSIFNKKKNAKVFKLKFGGISKERGLFGRTSELYLTNDIAKSLAVSIVGAVVGNIITGSVRCMRKPNRETVVIDNSDNEK